MNNLIEVRDLSKTFTLHQQQGVVLNVLRGLNFNVAGGECLVLHGRSGAGKSTLLRTLYGNYLPAGGSIRLRHAGDWLELVGGCAFASACDKAGSVGHVLGQLPGRHRLDQAAGPSEKEKG
ncbi:phosphonate ABC transporter ATP-binding protein [Pseudomonas aeruginosa VRFPA09]|nr:phosphonate ABC transporter ATP-binding protein [Pseudomonas aeruginosa VRFPA09]